MKAAEKLARRIVAQRSGSICEGCGCHRATEWQHRQRRSQQGLWSAANGMHVCRYTHQWITEHPQDAAGLGWHVWSWQNPAEVPIKLFGRGWCLIDDAGGVMPCDPPSPDDTRSVA